MCDGNGQLEVMLLVVSQSGRRPSAFKPSDSYSTHWFLSVLAGFIWILLFFVPDRSRQAATSRERNSNQQNHRQTHINVRSYSTSILIMHKDTSFMAG